MQKILVVGASGKVGKILYNTLKNEDLYRSQFEAYGTFNSNPLDGLLRLDITNSNEVKQLLEKLQPDIIIQPAAVTYAELAEENQELARKVNVEGTKNLADYCRTTGAKMAYVSSDYVYDGESGPFSEKMTPNPVNYFGRTKVEAEKIVMGLDNSLVIRTAWVNDVDSGSKSFVMQMINSLRAGKTMRVPRDQYGHPTLADNLVEIIIDLMTKDKRGIYNVAGSTYIDRYSLAVKFAEAFCLDSSLIVGVETKELNQKATRPKKVKLDLGKITTESSVKPLSLEEQIDQMRKAYSRPSAIDGVKLFYLGSYKDGRGALTVLASQGRKDAPDAPIIQEVYLSEIPNERIVRAGHKHLKTNEFFYVLDGSAKFELVDDRLDSKTKGARETYFLTSRFLSTLYTPTGIYHALVSLEKGTKVLAISSKAYKKEDADTYPAPKEMFCNI